MALGCNLPGDHERVKKQVLSIEGSLYVNPYIHTTHIYPYIHRNWAFSLLTIPWIYFPQLLSYYSNTIHFPLPLDRFPPQNTCQKQQQTQHRRWPPARIPISLHSIQRQATACPQINWLHSSVCKVCVILHTTSQTFCIIELAYMQHRHHAFKQQKMK
jgi:hypothetical protein